MGFFMRAIKNLSGQVFGLLTVKLFYGTENGHAKWLCNCTCGGQWIGVGYSLTSGQTKSCGCLSVKHKESGSRLYKVWQDMLNRTRNTNLSNYERYGARGIAVDKNFMDYLEFKKCLLEEAGEWPGSGYSLDRINNNKGYEPGNLRWATPKQQQRNTRFNRIITINGEVLAFSAAVEKYGKTCYQTIMSRINNGWTTEEAFFTPRLAPGERKISRKK